MTRKSKKKGLIWRCNTDDLGNLFWEAECLAVKDEAGKSFIWRIFGRTVNGKTQYYAQSDVDLPKVNTVGTLKQLKEAVEEEEIEIHLFLYKSGQTGKPVKRTKS